MSGIEEARYLLMIADRDFRALKGMTDQETFANEIFGFHAQQAVEKALKAWLVLLGIEPPYTHDLGLLIRLLEGQACDLSSFHDLVGLAVFGVKLRYEYEDPHADFWDRMELIGKVGDFLEHVESLIDARDPDNRSL